ncbi:MAG: AraC family transcriptional regulator [Elainella sp. Prado103]|jgi:AraC-like DNA-binding protein|nr:AraC family transcriptional regulator [Elainella sp. Prado103]
MAIALSQDDYSALLQKSAAGQSAISDATDITWIYPPQLGHGFIREICLRDGLELAIADYQHHEDIICSSSDREHPLEYTFYFPDNTSSQIRATSYSLFGSGMAPGERGQTFAKQRIRWVSMHLEPEVFRSFAGNPDGDLPGALQHLIGDPNREYYVRPGQSTPAMDMILRQILHCPYQGFTQRMFLEGKVWELISLLLEEEAELHFVQQVWITLKPDDVDRVHHAKDILIQNLQNPPSLAQLARQVGLNECSLKRGFRQVFDNTAFGYLHHYRLEYAKQLLMTGEMTVAQVAQSIGFARNYFTKAFCQKFGCTPGAYRKSPEVRHFSLGSSKNSV